VLFCFFENLLKSLSSNDCALPEVLCLVKLKEKIKINGAEGHPDQIREKQM